ncbi:MAG: hypothetical protein WCQ54_08800 [Clostridiaceae bacterium]
MKKKSRYIIIIIIIGFSISTYFYLNSRYEKIDIFTAAGFAKDESSPISVTDRKTLIEISSIVKSSVKMDGIVNVVQPDYVLEFKSFPDKIRTIYLWLNKDSNKGMLMYKNKTETGYSISEENAEKLKQIVLPLEN